MARPPTIQGDTATRVVLHMQSVRLNDEQFALLCRDNRDLRIEMTAAGDLIIMSPTNMETGRKSGRIFLRLATWAERDGTGECFDSSSLLTLPNGAKRSPDASWILKSRWNKLSDEEKSKISRIYPDFVLELRSPSDKLEDLQEKMEEYIANGVRLGWLLDPIDNVAFVYTSGSAIHRIDRPTLLSGDPVLQGFAFDFREIL